MVRADVVDPRVPAPGEILGVEQGTAKAIGEPVELTMRAGTEVVVTGTEYGPVRGGRVVDGGRVLDVTTGKTLLHFNAANGRGVLSWDGRYLLDTDGPEFGAYVYNVATPDARRTASARRSAL